MRCPGVDVQCGGQRSAVAGWERRDKRRSAKQPKKRLHGQSKRLMGRIMRGLRGQDYTATASLLRKKPTDSNAL
jgi:hypothetical protein